MCRKEFLEKQLYMARHNLLYYSENYLCANPMDGYEELYYDTAAEIGIIEDMLAELHADANQVESNSDVRVRSLKKRVKGIARRLFTAEETIARSLGRGGLRLEDAQMYLRSLCKDAQHSAQELANIAGL